MKWGNGEEMVGEKNFRFFILCRGCFVLLFFMMNKCLRGYFFFL